MKSSTYPRLLLLSSLALSACTTTAQLQYHTLVPPASATNTSPSDDDKPFAIEVVPITVPQVVDRPQLVVRLNGTNDLRVLEQQQWASPLQSELRNAISFALSAELRARDVYNIDHPTIPVYRIAVTIQRFETTIGGTSNLQAAWSVRKPDSDQLASCQTSVLFAKSDSIDDAVAGYQRSIGVVAEAIGQVVRKFVKAQAPDCPDGNKTLK